jgi:hypothetical protein
MSTRFVDAEIPSGSVDGSNTAFTLAHAPNPAASLQFFVNGLLYLQGEDYELSGATITLTAADPPESGGILQASYRYGTSSSSISCSDSPAGDFPAMNADIVCEFGEAMTHTPEGASAGSTVRLVRMDPSELNMDTAGAFLILFGTPETSGFAQDPEENDTFEVGGEEYRAFKVTRDQTGGVFIYLTRN